MFPDKDSFLESFKALPSPSLEHVKQAQLRQKNLTKPEGSLGRLEDMACWLAGWQQTDAPKAEKINVTLFAGNHGLTTHNISPFPTSVTAQMVENFQNGGAAINQICKAFDLSLTIKPIMLEHPTQDITREKAMDSDECLNAINIGAKAVNPNDEIIVPGEMGIGNSTIASLLCAKIFGGNGNQWAGAGTGLNNKAIVHKANVIDLVLKQHNTDLNDPFELLCHIGGREIAAICGFIVGARLHRIPVILDGFIVGAAAAVLTLGHSSALDHCVAGHLSHEQAHKTLLENLKLYPALLDLDMRLGEGSGAALAAQVLRAATATHNGMASFEEAGISKQ